MSVRLLIVLLPLAAVTPPVPSGTVSGHVELVANGALRSNASNAVVWIEGAHRSASAPGAVRGQMKSDQKRFSPRVVVVPKTAAVDFPNVDPIYHNVFSVSGANRFDLGLYRSGASKKKEFDEPGLVRVFCNIHPQMVGFVMVVDSDFFAVTGADGRFRFEGVPAGNWTLKAWQEEGAEASAPLTVRLQGDAPATIRIDVTGFKAEPHKNKYGQDYPPQASSDDERY
ncbi:MAG TPA: carboxypeptidase regulatory-like domain-containing protein [Thermoanaerobaculia bacterium]|nr:carboxypeptidase regulatory-like domain-containing protein [Thermoanaerobaculia bacterium]